METKSSTAFLVVLITAIISWKPKLILIILAFALGGYTFHIPTTSKLARIGAKYEPPTVAAAKTRKSFSPNSDFVDRTIENLTTHIVRDFVTTWHRKINHSNSSEFTDATKDALTQVFLNLGQSIKQINPADLIVAMVKVVILRINLFKGLVDSNLNMADYLRTQPDNRSLGRFQNTDQVVAHLRSLSLSLSVALLPKEQKNSSLVFAICNEVLATSVFLPILNKITASDYLNLTLLNFLKKEDNSLLDFVGEVISESSGTSAVIDHETAVPEKLKLATWPLMERAVELQEEIAGMLKRIDFIDRRIDKADPSDMVQLMEDKLQCRGQLETLLEMIASESDKPENLVSISKAAITVRHTLNCKLFEGISKGLSFELTLMPAVGPNWTSKYSMEDIKLLEVALRKDVQNLIALPTLPLQIKLQAKLDTKASEEGLEEFCTELMIWFSTLMKDPVSRLNYTLVRFLQPIDNIHTPLSSFSVPELSDVTSEDASEVPDILVEGINTQDMHIILELVFTAIEELFLNEEQWLRQQSLQLIKLFLQKTFSKRLSNAISIKVAAVSSEESVAGSIAAMTESIWPVDREWLNGRPWGKGPPQEIRDLDTIAQTKSALYNTLTESEGHYLKPDLHNTIQNLKKIVGSVNTEKGVTRLFLLLQNQQFMIGLLCEVMEEVVDMIHCQ